MVPFGTIRQTCPQPSAPSQAHALEGSAASMPVPSLHAIALKMERAAAAGSLDRPGEVLLRPLGGSRRMAGESIRTARYENGDR